MGLFRPYEQGSSRKTSDKPKSTGATVAPAPAQPNTSPAQVTPAPVQAATESPAETAAPPRQPAKKGRPTPTRAEAEAARMARLHPVLSPKEQKAANREAQRAAQQARLEAAERSPERQLVRDYVDARPALVAWVLPAMLLLMAITWVRPRDILLMQVCTFLTLAIFVGFALSVWGAWRGWKKEADARGLHGPRQGLAMYLMNRMMTMRFMRRPVPRIKRGESY